MSDRATHRFDMGNWLRNRDTIEFLGIWEQLYNPGFNPIEFDGIRKQAGLNSFILTAKRWIDSTGPVGLISKPGRYVGAEEIEDDGEPFEEKMPRLVSELHRQLAESAQLVAAIRSNLKGLGYAF